MEVILKLTAKRQFSSFGNPKLVDGVGKGLELMACDLTNDSWYKLI